MVVQGTAIATLSVMKSTELQLSSSQGMSHACCSWEKYLQLPLFGVMQDWVAPYHLPKCPAEINIAYLWVQIKCVPKPYAYSHDFLEAQFEILLATQLPTAYSWSLKIYFQVSCPVPCKMEKPQSAQRQCKISTPSDTEPYSGWGKLICHSNVKNNQAFYSAFYL